jgi:D-sedoheptulose 7-phosphate isomerase
MKVETAVALAERRIRESLEAQQRLLDESIIASVVQAAETISLALKRGGKLLVFGNGGSAADATHIAAELVGRFVLERQGLPAVALADNSSAVTAIANDYGYERVFARQLEALARPGDVALGISTSGRSANVLAGLEAGRSAGVTTIALTGHQASAISQLADICIAAPTAETPRVQECHALVAHILCELVELEFA